MVRSSGHQHTSLRVYLIYLSLLSKSLSPSTLNPYSLIIILLSKFDPGANLLINGRLVQPIANWTTPRGCNLWVNTAHLVQRQDMIWPVAGPVRGHTVEGA